MTDFNEKVRTAMHRIEDLYNEAEGKCYISFSGGKDSTVLLALAKMCYEIYSIPEMIPAVFANTGIELGVTVEFVKWVKDNWYPNIEVVHPVKPFAWVLKEWGKPIKSKLKAHDLHQWHCGSRTPAIESLLVKGRTYSSQRSYAKHKIADKDMHILSDDFDIKPSEKCCDYMKKKPFKEYNKRTGAKGCITGIRGNEGGARETDMHQRILNGGKLCTYVKDKVIYKTPIIDWTDEDVDMFIDQYKIPLSRAYTEFGFTRTGCMACPFARTIDRDLEYLYYHEPNRYKASMFFLKDVYIAQDVKLPFDEGYEQEREKAWKEKYGPMRIEMLKKYRPDSKLLKREIRKYDQLCN